MLIFNSGVYIKAEALGRKKRSQHSIFLFQKKSIHPSIQFLYPPSIHPSIYPISIPTIHPLSSAFPRSSCGGNRFRREITVTYFLYLTDSHNGPEQHPHYCFQSPNPSVYLLLQLAITCDQDPKIPKLLRQRQGLVFARERAFHLVPVENHGLRYERANSHPHYTQPQTGLQNNKAS